MTSDEVLTLAEELPTHQTNRGAEFRTISIEERIPIARNLVTARSQAQSSNPDWTSDRFKNTLRRKKDQYMHVCGSLGVDIGEARHIWWSVVYNDPSPYEREKLV